VSLHLRGLPLRGLCLLGIGLLIGCKAEVSSLGGEPDAARSVASDPELCAEHGVLDSVCPKCNPRLVAVFQASGDWCDEHGFPESFCPICAPEQGGRPAIQPTATDGAPADGTIVRFRTRSAAAQAGLEVATAEEADWVDGTAAVARITWDATRVAAISARAAGVVSAIRAEVGDRVERGQILAEVRSAHVAGDRSRLISATGARDVAAAEAVRKRELLAGGVASERELLAAEQALAAAEAALSAVRAELDLVGGGSGDTTRLTTPIAGIITARRVNVGQSVDGLQSLFEVVDPSQMWAELDVPERDLGSVAAGQVVRLQLDALPGVDFTGHIATISPAVDPQTRTAQARVPLDNADGRLRANLYGTAVIEGLTSQAAVVVPAAAVQQAGSAHLVFVQQQVDTYTARRVRVLARQGDRVRVAGGVQAGDSVVTTGSFLLKTETLKDSIGAGCCDVE
jgi:cobalt-zinc-cadmium efflux system membrane fusion protein